jgi:hypothetical protein
VATWSGVPANGLLIGDSTVCDSLVGNEGAVPERAANRLQGKADSTTSSSDAQRVRVCPPQPRRGKTMLKFLTSVLVGAALLAPLCVSAADAPQGDAATTVGSEAADTKKALAQYREAMQATRSDIMAKGLTLSADQAAKFWPLFEQYQKEQNVIIDAQIDAIQKYSDHYSTLNDKDSVTFVKALLDRDDKMQALRVKWLAKFQTAVTGGTAARAIQLDRRLSLLAQAELASEIPLVH